MIFHSFWYVYQRVVDITYDILRNPHGLFKLSHGQLDVLGSRRHPWSGASEAAFLDLGVHTRFCPRSIVIIMII
jgi:hypothetical protein